MTTAATGTRGERTRADIVERAQRLFYARGFEATSFSDIVEASGLYRGNIYHYFRTKDELLAAVVERHLGSYRERLARWEREHRTPVARLLAFVDMLVGRQAELVEHGCPVGSLNVELGKERRDLQGPARALFDLFRGWLGERFRELGFGSRADVLALHLLGRAEGIAVIAHAYRDQALLRREARALSGWIRGLKGPRARGPRSG